MTNKEFLKVAGKFRVQLGEDGKVVGDSGWIDNQITNDGFADYICGAIGAITGSKQISHMNVGTGTAPASNATSLHGETGTRKTTSNSVVSSKTLQMTQSWASSEWASGTPVLQNVGLWNTASGGTLAAGNTYATSSWASNQGVSVTYQLRFS